MSDIFLATAFTYIGGSTPFPPYRVGVFVSSDGVDWLPFGKVPVVPESLQNSDLVHLNGQWWLAGAELNDIQTEVPNSFNLYYSPDLLNWSSVLRVSTGATPARTCSPTWFVDSDDSVHVFLSLAATLDAATFKTYEMHPLDDAMTTWSAPVEVTGTGFNLPRWDAHVVKVGSTYNLIYALQDVVELATSSSLTSGYTVIKTGDWAGWAAIGGIESPCPVKLDDGTWRIYLYHPIDNEGPNFGGAYYSETAAADLASGWSAPVACTGLASYSHPIMVYPSGLTAAYFASLGVRLEDGSALQTESGSRLLLEAPTW